MTMRWRSKRRDSLQADIRAYSRSRYAYLTTFFFPLPFPLFSSPPPPSPPPLCTCSSSESYSRPLRNLLPPATRLIASAEWNLLLRFRAGNASSSRLLLRNLCASVHTYMRPTSRLLRWISMFVAWTYTCTYVAARWFPFLTSSSPTDDQRVIFRLDNSNLASSKFFRIWKLVFESLARGETMKKIDRSINLGVELGKSIFSKDAFRRF